MFLQGDSWILFYILNVFISKVNICHKNGNFCHKNTKFYLKNDNFITFCSIKLVYPLFDPMYLHLITTLFFGKSHLWPFLNFSKNDCSPMKIGGGDQTMKSKAIIHAKFSWPSRHRTLCSTNRKTHAHTHSTQTPQHWGVWVSGACAYIHLSARWTWNPVSGKQTASWNLPPTP